MGLFNQFPFTNFDRVNLDAIMQQVRKLDEKVDDYLAYATITYADPLLWDITTQYVKSTVVINSDGTAYLSTQPVPAGIAITDTSYWTPIGNFSELWTSLKKSICSIDLGSSTTATVEIPEGSLFFMQNELYQSKENISAGSLIVEGSNADSVDMEEYVKANIAEANTYTDSEITTLENSLEGDIQSLDDRLSGDIQALSDRVDDIDADSLPQIVKGEEGEDITTALTEALATYDVVYLDGKHYTISSPIVVPDTKRLFAQGSTLEYVGSDTNSYILTLGASNSLTLSERTILVKDIILNCAQLCRGVKVIAEGAHLENCIVLEPKYVGYELGVSGQTRPGDYNLFNIQKMTQDSSNATDYGVIIYATDNVIDGYRSLNDDVGLDIKSASNILMNIHPLAKPATENGWEDTIGVFIDNDRKNSFVNLYVDNYCTGIVVNKGGVVDVDGYLVYNYNYDASMNPSAVRLDNADAIIDIKGARISHSDVKCLTASVTPTSMLAGRCRYEVNSLENRAFDPDDLVYNVQVNKEKEQMMWGNMSSGRCVAMFPTVAYERAMKIDIVSDEFHLKDLTVKNASGSIIVIDNGTISGSVSNRTLTLTIKSDGNDHYMLIGTYTGYAAYTYVTVTGNGCYVPGWPGAAPITPYTNTVTTLTYTVS